MCCNVKLKVMWRTVVLMALISGPSIVAKKLTFKRSIHFRVIGSWRRDMVTIIRNMNIT